MRVAAKPSLSPRDHEAPQEELKNLMKLDEAVRAKRDKLVSDLLATDDELTRIAAGMANVNMQLAKLHKKYANGNGRKRSQ